MPGVNRGRAAATRVMTNRLEPGTRPRHEDAAGTSAAITIVRRLSLRRRRSRVPWIYAVYHARLDPGPA